MNKNLKVISSLAMAGILAATGISTVSAATTKSLGVYRKLVEGKTVVPYVLASSNNTITAKNVKEEYGNITISLVDGSIVKTGTTFKKAGEEHTVVIYGDVNADGRVNVNDVTETAKAVFKTPTGVTKEAADVAHDGKINVNDVTTLAKFIVKNEALNISLKAEPVEEVNYDYTLAVNGNNVVNNVAPDAVKVVVTPKETFKEETYTVEVVKADGKTASGIASKTFTGVANNKTDKVELDFTSAGVEDGTYIVRLKLGDKVVGEVKVERHIDATKVKANVVAKRIGSDEAVVSLNSAEDAKIVKMYCTIGDNADTVIANVVKGTAITVINNTIPETLITKGNVATKAQVLSYVLEDVYGNRVIGAVNIPAHNATESTIIIKSIVAQENSNVFDITLNVEGTRDIAVTLYKDGKIIAVDTVSVTAANSIEADFSDIIKESGVGTYSIKAYVTANASEKQSVTVDSVATAENKGKIVVSQLVQVTDVKVDVTNNKITWKDTANKDVNYNVTILRPTKDELGDYTSKDNETNVGAVIVSSIDSTKREAVLPTIAENTSYKVEVVATSKTASDRIVNSNGVTSDEFFKVQKPNEPTIAPTSIEKAVKIIDINKAKLVGNKNATINYAVEVYKVEGNQTVLVNTKPVTLTKTEGQSTYETTVDGLEAGKTYKFVLTITVNGTTAKSAITSGTTTIAREAIAINNLTVNQTATEAKKGEICINGSKAYINGETIENINVFSTEYQAILNDIVKPLATGDKITVSEKNIVLNLGYEAATTTTLGGTSISGKIVEITGNRYYRTIETSGTEKAEKIVLNTGSYAVTTALNAKEVVLNGVKLQATNGTYMLKANVVNTINGSDVKVSKDTKVTPTSGTLTVVASDSNLEVSTSKALNIAISGKDDLALQQTGNITINAKLATNGTIGLTSPNATVVGNINVTIENGNIDITPATLKGIKNIIVNNVSKTETTTVVANLAATAPITTTKAVKIDDILKAYTIETEELAEVDGLTVASGKTGKEAIEFVKSLGIEEEADASIQVSAQGVITLTFAGNVTNYKVLGLK